jgi:hypothetical protein
MAAMPAALILVAPCVEPFAEPKKVDAPRAILRIRELPRHLLHLSLPASFEALGVGELGLQRVAVRSARLVAGLPVRDRGSRGLEFAGDALRRWTVDSAGDHLVQALVGGRVVVGGGHQTSLSTSSP